MTGAIKSAAERLPIIIGGAGPAGAATAIGLERAGIDALSFEARDVVATRARNIFLRPQARDILKDLTGIATGRDTTIMSIENSLRDVARREGVDISYNHQILDVQDLGDHVSVRVKDALTGAERSVDGSLFIDATGGRLPVTNTGVFERVPTSQSHVYVTAQYDTPAPFSRVFGAYDRIRDEGIFSFPIKGGKDGFVVYYDSPPGRAITDEKALLARYDTIAGHLQLGTPVTPPQAFDAQQHVSRDAADGLILKLGDSAGNADPYIGAGLAAALVNSRNAVHALTQPGDTIKLLDEAGEHVVLGHKLLGAQAGVMVATRKLGLGCLPSASFDDTLSPKSLGDSRRLDFITRFLTSQPVL